MNYMEKRTVFTYEHIFANPSPNISFPELILRWACREGMFLRVTTDGAQSCALHPFPFPVSLPKVLSPLDGTRNHHWTSTNPFISTTFDSKTPLFPSFHPESHSKKPKISCFATFGPCPPDSRFLAVSGIGVVIGRLGFSESLSKSPLFYNLSKRPSNSVKSTDIPVYGTCSILLLEYHHLNPSKHLLSPPFTNLSRPLLPGLTPEKRA